MSVTVRPYRKGKGGWMVDVRVRLADGSRFRDRKRFATTSKTAAHRWGEERERHLLKHGPIVKAKEVPTLEQFAPTFIERYAQANRHKPSGIAQKQVVLRVHLLPMLGAKRLDAITAEDVQRLKHRMREKSPKTVNNALTVLSKVLKVAVEWGVIDALPTRVSLLRTPDGSMHYWHFDQYQRLVDAATTLDSRTHVAVLLGGDAGLRAGEMRALEWRDLDFVQGQVRVERSEWRGKITSTKGNRVRYVPMTVRLAEALRHHRHLKSRHVLCEPNGSPLTANALAYLFERATRAAGLASGRKPRQAGPHVLRHTFASHLAMKGAPVGVIQVLAGHRDMATTQRYMHLSQSALDAAIRLLEPAGASRGNSGATTVDEVGNACG